MFQSNPSKTGEQGRALAARGEFGRERDAGVEFQNYGTKKINKNKGAVGELAPTIHE